MSSFNYQAYDSAGRLTAGTVEARHQPEALQKLSLEGLVPFHVAEASPGMWRKQITFGQRLRPADISSVLRTIATLLNAAIPIIAALKLAAGQHGGKLGAVLVSLQATLIRGGSLSDAMAGQPNVFSSSQVAAIRAGELAGNVPSVMNDLCDALDRQAHMRRCIASAAVYPAILLIVAAFALLLVLLVMVPALTPLFDGRGVPVPLILSVLASINAFASSYGTSFAVVLACIGASIAYSSRTEAFKDARDRALIRTPAIRAIVRRSEAAKFARTFGTLLRSGVPVPEALAATSSAMANRQCREGLVNALDSLRRGARLMEALASFDALSGTSRSVVALGEETNRLPEMLTHVAVMNETELQRMTERLVTVLTPALTVAIGLLVGGLIMSVMNAILSANDLAL